MSDYDLDPPFRGPASTEEAGWSMFAHSAFALGVAIVVLGLITYFF